MKIATYNINSVRARATNLYEWLKRSNPDIVFLQEIKCETENFIYFECESLGYKVAALGQKSYNGVAILSKYDFTVTAQNIPSFADDAMRYIEILVTHEHQKFYAASAYAPNGCSPDAITQQQKLQYKLNWFDGLYAHLKDLRSTNLPIVLGGDFNVMMTELDVYDSAPFKNTPLYTKNVQDKIIAIQNLGLHDCFRTLHPTDEGYTFWDYTANSFVTNSGLRIDYLFVTAEFAERLISCQSDKSPRMAEKPSDHTPLVAEFEGRNE